jgi:hypothetical protein
MQNQYDDVDLELGIPVPVVADVQMFSSENSDHNL